MDCIHKAEHFLGMKPFRTHIKSIFCSWIISNCLRIVKNAQQACSCIPGAAGILMKSVNSFLLFHQIWNLQFNFREIISSTYVTFLTSSANYVLVFIRLHPTTLQCLNLCTTRFRRSECTQGWYKQSEWSTTMLLFIKTPKQLWDDVILLC